MFSGCCGQPGKRRTQKAPEENLPENPVVDEGVRLLYLGAGRRDFEGAGTGLHYIVSDHRRTFVAHPDDARALLRDRFVIPAP
jgi:hypothetical protein